MKHLVAQWRRRTGAATARHTVYRGIGSDSEIVSALRRGDLSSLQGGLGRYWSHDRDYAARFGDIVLEAEVELELWDRRRFDYRYAYDDGHQMTLRRVWVDGEVAWSGGMSVTASWRPVTDTHWQDVFDAVLLIDRYGHSGRRYSAFSLGEYLGSRPTFEAARGLVEAIYGPLDWEHMDNPPVEVVHRYFGPTTEFTEPVDLWFVERLPVLGGR